MTTMSQGGYATAVGSLDWLDVSYNPLQLTQKYRLPTLVRIGEGHYGNEDDTCFSAMEVVKLHGVQRVDMVCAESTSDKDDPNSAEPIRICLPKGLACLFNVHPTGEDNNKGAAGKKYTSVRQLADDAPQCIKVVRKPYRNCGVVKGDILRTIGITMCNGMWEEQGLRCRKQGEPCEDVLLNLKWKGQYRTVPDPEGYTLANIVSQNKLPCTVTLLNPEDHLSQLSSSIGNLLPLLQRPIVLERVITTEFLVGTTIGAGPSSSSHTAGNLRNNDSSGSRKPDEHQQPAVVVLSKNANVCFQICQDMVHRRITYTSLLDMFGDCTLDKIPLELFISEYAAPVVAFMRTDPQRVAPPTAVPRKPQVSQRVLSRSTPDLPSTNNDDGQEYHQPSDEVIHDYADPEREKKSNRALPPLPTDPHLRRSLTLQPRLDTSAASSLMVNNGQENDDNIVRKLEGLHAPLTNPTRAQRALSHLPSASTNYTCQRPCQPQSQPRNPVSAPHPEPPPGFTSDLVETEHHQDQVRGSSESPDRLPSRRPPPPPPRTTPQKVAQEALYSNLDAPPPPLPSPPPPNNDVTRPSQPAGRSPPEVSPRTRGLKGSLSLNVNQRLSPNRLRDHSAFHTIPFRGRPSPTSSVCGGCVETSASRDTHADYLQPRKSRFEVSTNLKTPASLAYSRSHKSTGMLLDDIDLSHVQQTTLKKERSSSESHLQISGLQAVSIEQVGDIPVDIGKLSCSKLMQCLRMMNLDDQIVERVQRSQINGSLLLKLSSATIKDELALSDFEAEKVDAFKHGWRPDDSEAS